MLSEVTRELQTEEITSLKDLEEIREEWFELLTRCPTATPFQSPEWLLPWCHCLGPQETLVVLFRHEERLVGLVPLVLRTEQYERTLFL
ncbi:MAG: hypothetical protein JWQ71_4600, partial [Pedosphaera sp.]|nr:hypothetical protein [Pedosphaera sp.]